MLLGAFAALVLPSCIKEDVQKSTTGQEYEMVPVTFSAVSEQRAADVNDESADTKVVLKDGSYQWEADTYVSVFTSAAPELNNKYKVLSSGATSDFEGELPAGHAAPYYAVAPYNASNALNADGTLTLVIPAVQTAVKGSIPPETPFVAKSDNQKFSFQVVTGFIKFTMNKANVKEVTFSGNGNEYLAATVKYNTETLKGSVVSGTGSQTVTLKMPDGEYFEEGGDYYIAIRNFSFDSGITISYLDKDGNRFYRTTTNKPTNSVSRNRYMTLKFKGEMNDDTPYDLYIAWLHGFDIDFGGEILSKATYPGAVKLIQKDSTCSITKGAIYFIEPDKEFKHSNSLEKNIFTCRYADKRAKFMRSDASYVHFGSDAFCIWKNMYVCATTGTAAYYMAPNPNCNIDKIIFDGCKFDVPANSNIISCPLNSDEKKTPREIRNLIITGCDVSMLVTTSTNSKGEINSYQVCNAKGAYTMSNLVFTDNVFYCTDGTKIKFSLLSNTSLSVENIKIEQNTFVNHYFSGGFVNINKITTSATVNNNINYFDDYTNGGGDSYTYYYRWADANSVESISENNYSIYKGTAVPARRLKDKYTGNIAGFVDSVTEEGGSGTVQTLFELNDPTKFNITNGIFMSADVKYGAQRDWSKYTGAAAN